MKVKDLCKPAYVYFIIAIIHIVMYSYMIITKTREFDIQEYTNYSLIGLIVQIIFSLLWVLALNSLCKWKPHGEKLAWLLVLLPFIFIGLIIVGISGGLTYLLIHDKNMKQLNEKINKREIVTETETKEGYSDNLDHSDH